MSHLLSLNRFFLNRKAQLISTGFQGKHSGKQDWQSQTTQCPCPHHACQEAEKPGWEYLCESAWDSSICMMYEIWDGTSQTPQPCHVLVGAMGKASLAFLARSEPSVQQQQNADLLSMRNFVPVLGRSEHQRARVWIYKALGALWCGCSQHIVQRLCKTVKYSQHISIFHRRKGSLEGYSKYQRKVLALNHFLWEPDSFLWIKWNPRGKDTIKYFRKVLTE